MNVRAISTPPSRYRAAITASQLSARIACFRGPSGCSIRIGNSDGESGDDTLASMPCASSRPRTTSVSIDEWLRKISTGLESDLMDLDDHHRHVVVRLGAAHEGAHLANDAFPDRG